MQTIPGMKTSNYRQGSGERDVASFKLGSSEPQGKKGTGFPTTNTVKVEALDKGINKDFSASGIPE